MKTNTFNFHLRLLTTYIGVILLLGIAPLRVMAGAPNPAAKVLIIFADDTCSGDPNAGYETAAGVTFLQKTLQAVSPSPQVDLWQIPCSATTAPGIQTGVLNPANPEGALVVGNETTLTQAQLNAYCEVWDIRFYEIGVASPCSGLESDVITTGANSDTTFFTNYLAQNGNLLLVMDNSGAPNNDGFCNRDTSVVNFVSSVIGCTIPYSAVLSPNGQVTYTTFSAAYNFSTNFNTLTSFWTDFPGGLLSSNLCGGTALTTDSTGVTVVDALWKPSGGGTVEVNMDTNAFCEWSGRNSADNLQYYQNVYTLLANCVPPITSPPTNTATVTSTQTPTMTATNTVFNSPTNTATITDTSTVTNTTTNTQTNTPTSTATVSVTNTPTSTQTNTATNTVTSTPPITSTPTNTFTATVTSSPTYTPTITPSVTSTFTSTPSITPTPGLYVFPNPFNPAYAYNGYLKAGFFSLGPGAKMSLYTISGEFVIDSDSGGNDLFFSSGYMYWNGRNKHGLYVSTGVYYYVIQNSSTNLLTGKILVVTGK